MILLTVWGDPIPWKRPGLNKSTGAVYDQQAKEKERYRWQIASQASEHSLKGPLEIMVVFYLDVPKKLSRIKKQQMMSGLIHHMTKPDVDNLQKFILDCMTGIIYADDAQVWSITAVKCYSNSPRTTISVRPINSSERTADNDCD